MNNPGKGAGGRELKMADKTGGSLRRLRHAAGALILPSSPSASSFPFWEYGKWLYWTRRTPDFPRVIDIQTRSGCNARCLFCTVGREKNKAQGSMPDELWQAVIDEILSHGEVQRIHPYLLNDPLVDRGLPEKLEYFGRRRGRRRGPRLHLISNAGLLTEEMGYRLLRSESIDEFDISFHSIRPEVYEEMMPPLKYEKVMANILRFKEQWDRFRGRKPALNVWTVRTRPVLENLAAEKAYWKKLGIGFKARKLDNRADESIEKLAVEDRPYRRVDLCPIPFWRAWIMWNGDMIMCCVDQERSNLLGNCSSSSIGEVWNNAAYGRLRERWKRKKLEGLLCEHCKGT